MRINRRVAEQETEAAATAVGFEAVHPFLFVIRETSSGLILLIGKVGKI